MASTDTFTSNTGQIIQQAHTNLGIWGPLANTNFQISDKQFGGKVTKTFSNADIAIVNEDGVADEGKNSIFICTGTLSADVNLILPTAGRHFLVVNNCTGAHTLTAKTVAGTGVVIAQGATMPLYCDGVNILPGINLAGLGLGTMSTQDADDVTITGGSIDDATITGGTIDDAIITDSTINGATFDEILSTGNIQYTGQAYGNVQTLTDAATIVWDMNLGDSAVVTPTTDRTMGNPTNLQKGNYALKVISGGHTLTWNAVFKWPSGVAPVSGGGTDIYTFKSFDGTTLDGVGQVSFA